MNGAGKASSFWAQKAAVVKSSATPTLDISGSPKPNETMAAKKGFVMNCMGPITPSAAATDGLTGAHNGTTNGTTNGTMPSTPKQTDWADSEDDEDFYAAFSATKDPRIVKLEHEVAHKSSRIEELENTLGMKDMRITQLEGFVEEKVGEVVGLEAAVEDKDARIIELKNDNHVQYLYVQELVAEVDEKARRIMKLEGELDVKATRIHELEMESESNTQASTQDLDIPNTNMSNKPEPPVTPPPEEIRPNFKPEDIQAELKPKDTQAQSKPESIPSDTKPTPSVAPADEPSAGPTVNEGSFPKMWSPDAPKKVLPPVEKPKILKMGIDMSKYGKKAPVKMPQPHQQSAAKARPGHTLPWGQASRQNRTKTAAVPKIEPHKDIRHMPHADRVIFANGSDVTVTMGDAKLGTLPKYVLMQCSEKANKYFTEHPDATTLAFPAGSMDAEAAKAHVQWMDEMTYQGRVYSITLNADEKFDERNLKICQAARIMGMNNTYVGHFTKILCDRVRSNTSSMDFMSTICELAYPDNDPIFECLANNLVNQQLSNAARAPEELEKLQAKFPILKVKMESIGQRVKNNRAAEKRKGMPSRDGSRDGGGSRSRPRGDGKKLA